MTGLILIVIGVFFLGLCIGVSINHLCGRKKAPEPETQLLPIFTSLAEVAESILAEEGSLEGCAAAAIAQMEIEWWARRGVFPDDDNEQVVSIW